METSSDRKRKADVAETQVNRKKSKRNKKKWTVPHNKSNGQVSEHQKRSHMPEVGDAGIWVTCDMNKEAKTVSELRPLLEEHAARMYGVVEKDGPDNASRDVESDIAKELDEIRDGKQKLFQNIRIDTQCLIFFKTLPPIIPADFVLSFCQRAQSTQHRKGSRCVRKVTPITLVGKANEKGLEDVAKAVLAPQFHDEASVKKFAIRVNLRNHTTMKREDIIKRVATMVGPTHQVDLKNYDLLILVEVYQTIVGMSVVGNQYDALKKYNLAEIYNSSAAV